MLSFALVNWGSSSAWIGAYFLGRIEKTMIHHVKHHHINPSQYSFSQNNGRQSANPNYLYHSAKDSVSRYNQTERSTTKIVTRAGTEEEVIIALPKVRRQLLWSCALGGYWQKEVIFTSLSYVND